MVKMKMLISTCGTIRGENAIEVGGKIAKALGAKVTVLYIKPRIPDRYHKIFDTTNENGETLREKIEGMPGMEEEYLKTAVDILSIVGLKVETKVKRGDPALKILEESKNYDLVVTGARDLNVIERMLFGSVSRRVAEYAKTSVLVVRRPRDISNILIATDGSPSSEEAVYCACYLAKNMNAKLTILAVALKGEEVLTEYGKVVPVLDIERHSATLGEAFAEAAKCALKRAEEIIEKFGVKAETKIRRGRPSEEILKESEGYDMVILGSRGLTGFKKLLIGHVSLKVLSNARTNVLIVKNWKFK